LQVGKFDEAKGSMMKKSTTHSYSLGKLRQAVLLVVVIVLPVVSGCDWRSSTSDQYIQKAKDFRDKGQLRASIIELKNALQESDSGEARLLLAEIYIKVREGANAEKELLRAQKLGIDEDLIKIMLGQALLLQDSYARVLNEVNPGSGTSVKDIAKIQQLHGEAQFGLGHPNEGCDLFKQSAQTDSTYVPTYWGLARCAAIKKDFEHARMLLEQALKLDDRNTSTWMWLGKLAQAENDSKAAEAAYSTVLGISPDHIEAHQNLAFLHLSTGRYDIAQAEISAARKVAPNNLRIIYLQALLDFRQANYVAARDNLLTVLKNAPDDTPSLLLSGLVFHELGSFEQASQNLTKVLNRLPDNVYARKGLANTLMKKGQPDRALVILKPLLTAEDQDLSVWMMASQASLQAGEPAKAREYLQRATAFDPKNSQLRAALGMSLMAAGDSNRAMAELESAATGNADQSAADTLLILSHLDKREYDKALAAITKLEKKLPNDPIIYNFRGAVYAGKKDAVNARRNFEQALAISPNYKAALINLAQLDMQDKNLPAARKRFEAILATDNKHVESMLALARLAVNEKERVSWLEQAVKADPSALQPSVLLAQSYMEQKQPGKALALAQEAVRANPNSPHALDLLGTAQWSNGEKDKALATYTQLTVIAPKSPLAYYKLASVQGAGKDADAVRSSLNKALTLKPDYLPAQTALIWLEVNAGKQAEALKIAQGIQKQSPKSPMGLVLEGRILLAQNNYAEAARAYEKAFAIESSGSLAIEAHKAWTLAGDEKKADSGLLRWLKGQQDDLGARNYLAQTYLKAGRNKQAIEQYQLILQKSPDNVLVLNNLAGLYQQEKNPRARAVAEKAYKLNPDSSTVVDTLGWILLEQGETARSVELLQRAAAAAPNNLEIGYHYAVALARMGEKTRARTQLKKLLTTGQEFPQREQADTLLNQL
jgi:putative PEP-CTERM system TPR-repeat lipoprotein